MVGKPGAVAPTSRGAVAPRKVWVHCSLDIESWVAPKRRVVGKESKILCRLRVVFLSDERNVRTDFMYALRSTH